MRSVCAPALQSLHQACFCPIYCRHLYCGAAHAGGGASAVCAAPVLVAAILCFACLYAILSFFVWLIYAQNLCLVIQAPFAGKADIGKTEDNTGRLNSSISTECWAAGWLGASWH